MSDVISLTAAMRSNLLTLQKTDSQIGTIQNILATGKKVNSALDDPTAFFAAQALSNRASDLSALLDSMGQAVSTVQAADDGISAATDLVNQMKSVAQSAKDGATGSSTAKVFSKEFTLAEAADITGDANIAALDSIDFSVDGAAAVTAAVVANDSLADYAATIDALAGVAARVVNGDTAGTLRLEITAETEGETLQFTNNVNDLVVAGLALEDVDGVALADAQTITPGTGAPTDAASLQSQYNELVSQYNDLIGDSGYRGTNLLGNQDLTVTYNEDGTSTQTLTGKDFTTAGTIATVSAASDFSSVAEIDAEIARVDATLANLRTEAKVLGNSLATVQTRLEFTKEQINNLEIGSDKLTLADKNEEGAKLLALQTSQQLGIQALSLASQSNQSVLQLFR